MLKLLTQDAQWRLVNPAGSSIETHKQAVGTTASTPIRLPVGLKSYCLFLWGEIV
jgi:hypothetical protein